MIGDRRTPIEKEWDAIRKKELKYLNSRSNKKDSFLNRKLEEKVPEKLQTTLDTAFCKAFELIFEKGTGIIEKTYKREEAEKNYQINEFTSQIKQDRKSLKAFSKKAKGSGSVNLLLSGASGVGMGVLGIGLPDIPLFTGMVLKGIYEIALSYGYSYESEQERYFILTLIQGALSYGDELIDINQRLNEYMRTGKLPDCYDRAQQIKDTAGTLSKELLYMKFLQGIPVVGAVGGFYDAIYMKQIVEYANLKYQYRFLREKL
ncbi:MAG: EcsC family protein [Lachnospiraceae bacterium]|nr:EcsC family protein [Lachnospiraceae bacterium]